MAPRAALGELEEGGEVGVGEEVAGIGESGVQGVEAGAGAVAVVAVLTAVEAAALPPVPHWTTLLVLTNPPLTPKPQNPKTP